MLEMTKGIRRPLNFVHSAPLSILRPTSRLARSRRQAHHHLPV